MTFVIKGEKQRYLHNKKDHNIQKLYKRLIIEHLLDCPSCAGLANLTNPEALMIPRNSYYQINLIRNRDIMLTWIFLHNKKHRNIQKLYKRLIIEHLLNWQFGQSCAALANLTNPEVLMIPRNSYTVAVYSWSKANNFVIGFYCSCLQILCQIEFSSLANYFRSYRKKQLGKKSVGVYSRRL